MKLSLWCLGISVRVYIVTIANVPLIFDLRHRIRTCSSKTRQLHQVKKTSAIDFKPGLHKQRKPLRPIIGFDRTRGWGYSTKFYTGRTWDVPSGVIFCGSCILMLLGICCIYFSNTFFIMLLSVPGFLLLPEQYRWLSSPTFFRWFRFEGIYILTVHGMVISKSRQVLSCLFLITMSGLLAFISRSVCQSLYWHLPQDCDTVFFCYCLCLYSSLCRCFGVDTGTSNDDLPLNTLKTLLRLPRVLKAF